jgi:DNA-binding MarR family transcriptional regulator
MKYSLNEVSAGKSEEIIELLPAILRKLVVGKIAEGTCEMTIPQMRTLGIVARNPGSTMSELACALGGSMSAATALTHRLVQHGFIQRNDDPHDRRIIRLHLTEAGDHAYHSHRKEAIERVARALESLTEAQRVQIRKALSLLHQALEHAQSNDCEEIP